MAKKAAKLSEDEQEIQDWVSDVVGPEPKEGEDDTGEEHVEHAEDDQEEDRGGKPGADAEEGDGEEDRAEEKAGKEDRSWKSVDEDDEDEEEEEAEAEGGKPKKQLKDIAPSAFKELVNLRRKNRELREQVASYQQGAPPPAQGPGFAPRPGEAVGGKPVLPPIPLRVSEDGTQYIDPADFEEYQARRAALSAPSPQQVAQQGFQAAINDYIMEDPERHRPVVDRLTTASQSLELLMRRTAGEMGVQPTKWPEWERLMETTGAMDEFRNMYPEIDNVGKFINAYTSALAGNVDVLRYYADDYINLLDTTVDDDEDEDGIPIKAKKKLTPGRPKAMARKGKSRRGGRDSDMTRYQKLEEEIDKDPLGENPDTQQMVKELDTLAKKLGLE